MPAVSYKMRQLSRGMDPSLSRQIHTDVRNMYRFERKRGKESFSPGVGEFFVPFCQKAVWSHLSSGVRRCAVPKRFDVFMTGIEYVGRRLKCCGMKKLDLWPHRPSTSLPGGGGVNIHYSWTHRGSTLVCVCGG